MDTKASDRIKLNTVAGELIFATAWADHRLNEIFIRAMQMGQATMIDTVVASIETARKIAILRAWCKALGKRTFLEDILKYLDEVEALQKIRNHAAHSIVASDDKGFYLTTLNAIHFLKTQTGADRIRISDLRDGIVRAEKIEQLSKLASGERPLPLSMCG